jgi:hypothetical protein
MVSHYNIQYSSSLRKGSINNSSDCESDTLEFSSVVSICQEAEQSKNSRQKFSAEEDFFENNSPEETPFLMQSKKWLSETKETQEEFEKSFRVLQSRRSSICSRRSSSNSLTFTDKDSFENDVFLVQNSPKTVSTILILNN